MNTYNFLQTGGFPFEADILQGMQEAYKVFNSLGSLAGNMTIISGCVITGSVISNGFVHIDGEIYPFVGGTIQTNVVFQTITQSVEFEDLVTRDIQIKKYVQFGTGVGSMLWADFKRCIEISQIPELLDLKEDKTIVAALQTQLDNLEAIVAALPGNVPPFLLKGNYVIGDVGAPGDVIRTVTFPSVGTSNYMVVGSLLSNSSNYNVDNDAFWTIKDKTATSFKLCLREISADYQNLDFNFALIAY